MNTYLIVLIVWTIISTYQFPIIWIMIDPLKMKQITCILYVIFNIPGFLLWGLFFAIIKITIKKVDKYNKVVSAIEKFYFENL